MVKECAQVNAKLMGKCSEPNSDTTRKLCPKPHDYSVINL